MGETARGVAVTRVRGGVRATGVDRAATEEPLEVRLHGRPFAVIMRTPGADCQLAAGFLLAERLVTSPDDIGTIEHCTDPAADHPENIVDVTLVGADLERLLADRRRIITSSSCGMCGRLTIESLRADGPRLPCNMVVTPRVVNALPAALRAAQAVFEETGGLHAAGLFTTGGRLEAIAEDVGRHNAVDKVVGRMLLSEALPLEQYLLFVSGRTSFEIVQKAFLAGIPIVASVSAPSSLAIELALDTGITLIGFVRGGSFNVYAYPERVTAESGE
ncbi:MAG: formate dehydrogenase accessory sulfurtransferase FdhD [Luteitalea sp.]|nr:formate dehydrogenase accessory sulfurtransferase FdhD [Luteitalea sp.]